MKRFCAIGLLLSASLSAATIAATGSWSRTLNAASLVSGAGSNLPGTIESATDAITVDTTFTPALATYNVYARAATGLPSGVTLAIKRSADGLGPLGLLGTITGGTSYITLSSTDTLIFTGYLDRTGVTLQIRATGVSVAVPPATYLSGVVLSITP